MKTNMVYKALSKTGIDPAGSRRVTPETAQNMTLVKPNTQQQI